MIIILQEFPESLFHGADVETILGDDEVSSRQARVTVRKGHNYSYDRWIAIKILQVFLEALLHGADEE
jgi:hypothetical protein